ELVVEVTTIDDELSGLDIDRLLLKLDVEGMEVQTLHGGCRTLERVSSVVILTELNPRALQDAGMTAEAMFQLLEQLGLRAYAVEEEARQCVPVSRCDVNRKCNLYCEKG